MQIQTKCVHGDAANGPLEAKGAVSVPIYQTATFAHQEVGQEGGYSYSRLQNPTREALEKTVAALEEGVDAMAFSSGMAALVTLAELFKPGDHILATRDLYGGTIRFFENVLKTRGIEVDYVDTSDIQAVQKGLKSNTAALYVETPTNPMMDVSDLRALAALKNQCPFLFIVDNTFLSPYFQKPLTLGADIVLHSGTKYLCGHNDTLAGFLVAGTAALSEKLRYLMKTTGGILAPFDCWLLIRGIKTLAVRMEQQQKNAMEIALWLKQHPRVTRMFYAGLEDHPGYQTSKRQATGFGAMISFETDTEKTALDALKRVKLIQFAESLGGVESLMTYPVTQTHADVPVDQRLARGITERLLRLSVGIEAAGDLIADLAEALG